MCRTVRCYLLRHLLCPSLTVEACSVAMAGLSCRIQWQTCEHSCRHRQGSWRGLQPWKATWLPSSAWPTACRASCWSSSRAMTICSERPPWLTCSWMSHEKLLECAYSIACWRYGTQDSQVHTHAYTDTYSRLCLGPTAVLHLSTASVPK